MYFSCHRAKLCIRFSYLRYCSCYSNLIPVRYDLIRRVTSNAASVPLNTVSCPLLFPYDDLCKYRMLVLGALPPPSIFFATSIVSCRSPSSLAHSTLAASRFISLVLILVSSKLLYISSTSPWSWPPTLSINRRRRALPQARSRKVHRLVSRRPGRLAHALSRRVKALVLEAVVMLDRCPTHTAQAARLFLRCPLIRNYIHSQLVYGYHARALSSRMGIYMDS